MKTKDLQDFSCFVSGYCSLFFLLLLIWVSGLATRTSTNLTGPEDNDHVNL